MPIPSPSPGDVLGELVGLPPAVHTAPLLEAIAAQAVDADRSRSIDPAVVRALKQSDVLSLSATKEIGGVEESITQIGWELAAVAARCASTAWCLWNHLCVFHLFCGALGPDHLELLRGIVDAHEWVCFPAGAGSRVFGALDTRTGQVVLNGPATFGSGARYGEWAGVACALGDGSRPPTPDELRFSIVRLDSAGVEIEPTWDGAALRASATDTVHYRDVRVPVDRLVPWYAANRAAAFRDPSMAMIHDRYRDDWVGISDLWLAAMAVGVVSAALVDAARSIGGGRKAIMGARMVEMPTVQSNVGEAASLVTAARLTVAGAMGDVDDRLARGGPAALPTEADHQRQVAASVVALRLCDDAMRTLARTLGGNALRESGAFERQARDLSAMLVHINAHPDRVHLRVGQLVLDVTPNRF